MKKRDITIIIGLTVFFILILLGIARNVAKRDIEYVNKITDVEHMEKTGEAIGKASNELKSKKDAFLKGYKSVKNKNDDNR